MSCDFDWKPSLTITTTFTKDGALTNATVTGSVRQPDGTDHTLTGITNPSTGVYKAQFNPTMPGRHVAVFTATGALDAIVEDTFNVRKSKI